MSTNVLLANPFTTPPDVHCKSGNFGKLIVDSTTRVLDKILVCRVAFLYIIGKWRVWRSYRHITLFEANVVTTVARFASNSLITLIGSHIRPHHYYHYQ